MAATTTINRYTGAASSQVATAVSTGTPLKITRDDSNSGTTPIPIPTSTGTAYSQEVVIGLGVTAAGGTISNRRLALASATPTGFFLYIKSANDGTTYVQGGAAPANAGSNATAPTGYSGTALGTTNVQYDNTSVASTVTTNTAGATANGAFQRIELGVDNTATSTGTVSLPNLSLVYDEQ